MSVIGVELGWEAAELLDGLSGIEAWLKAGLSDVVRECNDRCTEEVILACTLTQPPPPPTVTCHLDTIRCVGHMASTCQSEGCHSHLPLISVKLIHVHLKALWENHPEVLVRLLLHDSVEGAMSVLMHGLFWWSSKHINFNWGKKDL